MLDLKLIRESPELVRQSLKQRGIAFDLDSLLELDQRHRNLLSELEELRAKHNQMSKQIGRGGKDKEELIARTHQMSEEISALQQEVKQTKDRLESLLLELPNIPRPGAPVGKDESGNIVVRSWGEPKSFSFTPRPTGSWGRSWEYWTSPAESSCRGHGSTSSRDWGRSCSGRSSPLCLSCI